jgi:hypothetical protein
MGSLRFPVWAIAWAMIVAGASGAQRRAAPDAAERPELLPRHERWIRFPQVQSVCIDRERRAWFVLAEAASIDEIKRQVERSVALAAPWVGGGRILLFDSAGRVWISPAQTSSSPTTRRGADGSNGARSKPTRRAIRRPTRSTASRIQ